jgi:hypothetical protein
MLSRSRFLLACFSATAVALAWQGGVAAVGMSDAEAQNVAKSFFSSSGLNLPGPYFLKGAVAAQMKTKSAAERAPVVRDMSLYAKRLVSSPAFASMYNGWIKDHYQAVDHGIKIDPQADAAKFASNPEAAMKQMQNSVAAQMAHAIEQMPPAAAKMLFDQDLQNWKDDKDKARIYARAKQVAPLATSNPNEFRKQYALLKSVDMGGPDSAAGMEAANAANAKAQAEQQARQEQIAFNDHKLPVELKRRLTEFITLARSVDFTAQTRSQNGKMVFVKPEYERKPDGWKKLFRLGKEPTMAMLAVAEQWQKEL